MPVYIGLSVSRCVKDIALGYLDVDDVLNIVGATNFDPSNEKEVQDIIDRYQRSAWSGVDGAEKIFRRLLSEGKIEQPRRIGKDPYHINLGHWIVQFTKNELIAKKAGIIK